jgi:alpha-tubulin suppressor-like RCC1 family protein
MMPDISMVSAHSYSVSAVVKGTQLWTWGILSLSGRGVDAFDFDVPRLVHDYSPIHIESIKSTDTSTVLLLSNGTVQTWGSGNRYRYYSDFTLPDAPYALAPILGLGETVFDVYEPRTVSSSGSFIRIYCSGDFVTYALDDLGRLWVWGSNATGTTGTGKIEPEPVILNLVGAMPPGRQIVDVDASHTAFALLDDGSYICWGQADGYLCGGNANAMSPGIIMPTWFRPPQNIAFTKIIAGSEAAWALANDSSVWGWGSVQFGLMPSSSLASSHCETILDGWKHCSAHRLDIPGQVKDIWNGLAHLFALNSLGEIWHVGGFIDVATSTDNTLRQLPISLPPGHTLDWKSSQVSGFGYFWVTKFTPLLCTTPPPVFGNTVFNCVNGIWTSQTDATLGSDVTLQGPVYIGGNLTISQPITVTIDINSNNGKAPLVVEGCIEQIENLKILIELTEEQLKGNQIDPAALIEFNSSCTGVGALTVDTRQPKSCKRVSASIQSSTGETRSTLAATFNVNRSKCNTWWHVLIGVLAAVIVVAIALTLLFSLHPGLRKKCRPFAKD